MRLHYKDQPVLIIREVYEMHKYTVWAKRRAILMLKRAARIVTAMRVTVH